MTSSARRRDNATLAAVTAFTKIRQQVRAAATSVAVQELLDLEDDDERTDGDGPHTRLTRNVVPRPDYKQSPWANMLRNQDLLDPTSRAAKLFRRRFRVPHVFFLTLVRRVIEEGWFPTAEVDVVGRQCIPVTLKVLSALKILGRGNFFDDLCEWSYMSEPTIQASFHQFCKYFAEEFYEEHIFLPTGTMQTKVMEDFHKVGFTGAVGSTDVTHIRWDCCVYSLVRSYTGKEGFPTIAYQVTVDHSGRALAVTRGFAGAHNDKTIIRYDDAVQQIRKNATYTERVFQLRGKDGELIDCKGNYLIVDNGYHKWRVLQEPSKYPTTPEDTQYSKQLESVRKDVECFFGILKGRFRILKLPLLYRSKEAIDNVFFTCCILHNMLHVYDGMDQLEAGVHWAGVDGYHDPWIVDPLTDVSSVGEPESNTAVEVETAHDSLKQKLITSYAYRERHNDIVWLQR